MSHQVIISTDAPEDPEKERHLDLLDLRPKSIHELMENDVVNVFNAHQCLAEMEAIRDILYPLYEGQHEPLARMRDIAELAANEIRAARKKVADSRSADRRPRRYG